MRVFQESQRFTQWWIKLLNISLIVFLFYCFYGWYISKEAIGNVSQKDSIGQIVVIASTIPVVIFLYILKLKTWIDEVGLHYQFFPFHLSKKTIRWNELKKCYVRTYSPLKEYGGWGYRNSIGKKGKALNIKGNQGIQMEFKTGKRLLIGTQKETDASEVIKRHFRGANE